MSILQKFSDSIERQKWDHLRFIRNLLLLMVIINLMFYIFIFVLFQNEIIAPEYFQITLRELLIGNISGVLCGIIVNFLFLLIFYLKKEWDLHVVVPNALLFHVILSTLLAIVMYLSNFVTTVFETSYLAGFLTGGLIPILAYSGEVEKEHSSDNSSSTSRQ